MAASVQAKSVSYPVDSTKPVAEFPAETVVPHNNPAPQHHGAALNQDYDSTGSNDQQQNGLRYKNSGVVDENGKVLQNPCTVSPDFCAEREAQPEKYLNS